METPLAPDPTSPATAVPLQTVPSLCYGASRACPAPTLPGFSEQRAGAFYLSWICRSFPATGWSKTTWEECCLRLWFGMAALLRSLPAFSFPSISPLSSHLSPQPLTLSTTHEVQASPFPFLKVFPPLAPGTTTPCDFITLSTYLLNTSQSECKEALRWRRPARLTLTV